MGYILVPNSNECQLTHWFSVTQYKECTVQYRLLRLSVAKRQERETGSEKVQPPQAHPAQVVGAFVYVIER